MPVQSHHQFQASLSCSLARTCLKKRKKKECILLITCISTFITLSILVCSKLDKFSCTLNSPDKSVSHLTVPSRGKKSCLWSSLDAQLECILQLLLVSSQLQKAVLELALQTHQRRACLCPPSPGIKGLCVTPGSPQLIFNVINTERHIED